MPEEQTTPRGPKQDLPGRLSRDFRIHELEKIVAGGEGNKKYPARQCKVCLHVRSEVKLNTFVKSVFNCCTQSLVLRNMFQ